MKDLKKLLGKSLANQKIASIGRGAYINQVFKIYMKNYFDLDVDIDSYIKDDIFCIKVRNSSLSNLLFLHKKKVLDHINLKLQELDFQKVIDIKLI